MPLELILTMQGQFGSCRALRGPLGPKMASLGLWGLLYGPRVGQNVIKLCFIHVVSALRSFEAFHGKIRSVAPFIPVGM